MASTPFLLAQFTGQTANNDLSTYVPQSGDVNAVFARVSGDATTTSLVFRSPTGLKSVATAGGTVDVRYNAGTAGTSTTGLDAQFDFSTGTAVLPNGQVGGFTIGDDGAGNRVNVYINWTSATPSISVENVVGGVKSTSGLPTSVPFPTGAAYAASTAYSLFLVVRGSTGSYTANLFLALRGGSQVQVGAANFSIASLVLAGRKAGLRIATFATQTPGSDTLGLSYDKLVASDYSAGGGTALTAPAPTVAANGSTGSTVTAAPSGGTAPFSNQFQRAPDSSGTAGTYANVGTAGTATTYNDTGLTAGTAYWYRYIVTDTASGTATSTGTKFTVAASAGTPSFGITTTPASLALRQGESLTLTVTGTPSNGYAANPALSAVGLPSGITASFNPTSLTGGSGTSTLTLTAAGNALVNFGEFQVSATDGTLTQTAPVTLQVNPPSGVPTVTPAATDVFPGFRPGFGSVQVTASDWKAYLNS